MPFFESSSPFATLLTRAPRDAKNAGIDLVWAIILTVAATVGSIALTCLTPFVALAVAFAGTLRLRAALGAMTCAWLANQAVGFGWYHYPTDVSTLLWGVAIGAAVLLATVASAALQRALSSWHKPLAVLAAFVVSFAVYETTLLVTALLLGGLSTFTPAIIGQIAFSNGLWFLGMIVLNELVAALSPLWNGATTRLART